MTPDQVLDMEYWMFLECLKGYNDRMQDLDMLNISAGYWTSYYSNAKHPKKPESIIEQINLRKQAKTAKKEKPDIDTFLLREKRRRQYMDSLKK